MLQVSVTKTEIQCPDLSDCPDMSLHHPEGQCCPVCNATMAQGERRCSETTQSSLALTLVFFTWFVCRRTVDCVPQSMALQDTIGYVVHQSPLHGRCVNAQAVEGLSECSGLCQSGTVHEAGLVDPSSNCQCCQADTTEELAVSLQCEDGTTWTRILQIATSCSCQRCAGEAAGFGI